MINLTTEQIEKILDGAPDGATHYVNSSTYFKRTGELWQFYYVSGWVNTQNDISMNGLIDIVSLSELTLRHRVQELEEAINKINDAGTIGSCVNAITEAVALIPHPTKEQNDE